MASLEVFKTEIQAVHDGLYFLCLKKLSVIARTLTGTFEHPYSVCFAGIAGSPGIQLDTLF